MKTIKSKTVTLRGIDKEPNALNGTSQCSCAKCDSFSCFKLRNREQCSCKQCNGSCSISKKKNEIRESKSSTKAFNCGLSDTDSVIKERVKKEITYEYSNNNNLATVKKHSRYSYYTGEPRDNDKIFSNYKIGTFSDEVPHVHSATVVYTPKEDDTHTAKLSAQIMNVPYKEFKESISYNKPVSSPKNTKLNKYDIFRRIKEAYRACSCKVCECIVSKTLARSNYCKCKPCDCKDCADFIKTLENKEILKKSKQLYFVGCPCIRCNRTDCKGLIKNANGPAEFCDCDPCDCLRCKESFNEPCNCKPCECIECKSYLLPKSRTAISTVVASMQEDEPRHYCQCSPCDCAECGQHYLLSSSLRHEMATGMSRPDNCTCENCSSQSCEADGRHSCSCEKERGIMRKPVEKDTHDYDIHRASVKNTSIPDKRAMKDTITMFAAIKNNYLKLGTDNQTLCSCGDCECIVCSGKNNNAIFADQTHNIETCKCSPCECEICNKNNEIIRDNSRYTEPDVCNNKKDCDCSTCDCLQCDGILQPSKSISRNYTTTLKLNNMLANNVCKCSFCECTDCQNMTYNCNGDNCYCTKCKCQICSDQNKFIHETVYRNNNGCSAPFTLVTTSGDQNPENSRLFRKGEEFKFENTSRQNISDNLVSSDFEKLDDNPVKDVTNTLMPKCLPYGVQKTGNAKHSCEANVQFREKNIVMQYCNRKAALYGSSGSFLSVNSDDKSCDILNMDNVTVTPSPPEKICKLSHIKSSKSIYDMSKSTKTISKYLNGLTEHVNLKDAKYSNTEFTPTTDSPEKHTDDSYHGLNFACIKNITKGKNNSDHNVEIILPMSHDESATISAFSGLSTGLNDNNVLSCNGKESRISLENEIPGVKKTSFDLLSSLRNANKRLSKLMHTNVFQKIKPLKTKKHLSNTMTNIKDVSEKNNASGSFITNTSHLLTMEIDYDKIKTTLKQAKDFSDELMKILNEFKQANKKKECKFLKETSDSSSNINCMPIINNFEANISKVNNSTKYESLEDEIKLCGYTYNTLQKHSTHDLKIDKLEQVKSEKDKQTDKIKYDTEILPLQRSDSSKCELKGINSKDTRENIKDFNNEFADDQRDINAGNTSKSRQTEYYANEQLHEISCTKSIEDRTNVKPRLEKINLKNIKRSHIIRAVGVYKRLKLKEVLLKLAENVNFTDISTPAYSVPQSKQNIECTNDSKELNHGSPKNKRETTTTSTHTRYEQAKSMHEQFQVDSGTEDKSWSILRKNCLIELSNIDKRGFSLIPPLQLEIKDTLRTISNLHQDNGHREPNHETEGKKFKDVTIPSSTDFAKNQNNGKSKLGLELKDFIASASQTYNLTSSVEKAVDCMDETFSVMVLKRQLRELLNMSLTNPVQKRSLKEVEVEDSGGPSDKSKLAKRSSYYDPLKAKFLSLRRVSDHTVLVKWKAPLHVNNVQGYELLIDGRAVQKIISPSRCMAVVTCLPHVEKVLITIRTMVSSAVQCAQYPSTTIVYHLRVK